MTHDYKRNETTTLFAAMHTLDGTVMGRNMQGHRHQEFVRFLNAVEREVPAGKMIHVILDNYAPHKPPRRAPVAGAPSARDIPLHSDPGLLAPRRRRLFAILTKRRLKRTAQSGSFQWVADPDEIIAAVRRRH